MGKLTVQFLFEAGHVADGTQVLRINGQLITSLRVEHGIAVLENGSMGCGHSAHPSIHRTGSVKGMIDRGFWKKEHQTVRVGEFIYNTSLVSVGDSLDWLALAIERRYDISRRIPTPERIRLLGNQLISAVRENGAVIQHSFLTLEDADKWRPDLHQNF